MTGNLQPIGTGYTSINGWSGTPNWLPSNPQDGDLITTNLPNGGTMTYRFMKSFDDPYKNIMINKKFKSKLGILNKKMKFRILCKEYCDGHKEYIPQFRKWYQVQWVNLLASGTKQFNTTEDDAHKVLAQATKELVKHNEVIGEYDVEAYKKVSN